MGVMTFFYAFHDMANDLPYLLFREVRLLLDVPFPDVC